MNKISTGLLIAALPVAGGAVMFYDGIQVGRHNEIAAEAKEAVNHVDFEQHASNVDLDLQLVNTELKLLRTIEERRALTPDELDRKAYLESRRALLMAEQRQKENV